MTCGTCTVLDRHALNLFRTVLADKVENPVCLCKSLIGAAGTLEGRSILLGMLRSNVYSKGLRMKELFLTCGATKGQVTLVFLHMVVHRVLVLFDLGTDGADKLASGIFLIDVRHCTDTCAQQGFNFFDGCRANSASRSDYYDRHSSRPL